MNLVVTPLYALLLSVWLIVLSVRVIDLRGSPVTRMFHATDRVVSPEQLQRAVRGHGNLTEYMPTFLVLLLIAELGGQPAPLLHAAGAAFTAGRLMHGTAFSFAAHSPMLRIGGMALTMTGLLAAIVADGMCLLG